MRRGFPRIISKILFQSLIGFTWIARELPAGELVVPEMAGRILEQVLKLTLPQVTKPTPATLVPQLDGLEWGMVRGTSQGLPSWVSPVETPVLVLEGNAWRTARHADGSFEIVDANLTRRMFKLGAVADSVAGVQPGEWVPVPMSAEVAKLDMWLVKIGQNLGRSADPLRQDTARGRLLFWYAAAQAAGLTQAPAKAAELLNGTEGRERMLDQIMISQGDAAVSEAAVLALRSGDWKRYFSRLEEVVATYTRAWPEREKVLAWIALIRPVVAQPAGWLEEVKTLTPEQKAQAKVIFERIVALPDLPPVPWLLPSGTRMESTDPKVRESLAALRESGRALVPAWIALLSDASLTQGWGPVANPNRGQQSEESGPEIGSSLPRPAQRSDIARRILAGVMPERQVAPWRKFGGPAKAAAAWWNLFGKETDQGLALNYATFDTGFMQRRGIALVVGSGDEKTIARLEMELIGQITKEAVNYEMLGVQEYISLRGKMAEGFVDGVQAALKKKLDLQAAQQTNQEYAAKYLEQMQEWLKNNELQLRSLLEQRSAEESIADFLSGKRAGPLGLRGLQWTLQRGSYEDACTLVLNAALTAPRESQVWYLLGLLGTSAITEGVDRAARQAVYQSLRPQVEKLLAGGIMIPPTSLERPRLLLRVAAYLEYGLFGGQVDSWTGLTELARVAESEELAAKAVRHVLDLVDDRPVTPWRTGDEEQDGKALEQLRRFAELTADAVSAQLESLSAVELLALEKLKAEWPTSLTEVANRIRIVQFGGEKVEPLAALQGRALDAAVIREALSQAYAVAQAGRNITINLDREGPRGLRLKVETPIDSRNVIESAGYVRVTQDPAPLTSDQRPAWMLCSWQGSRYSLAPWWGSVPVVAEKETLDSAAAEVLDEKSVDVVAKPRIPSADEKRDRQWEQLSAAILYDLAHLQDLTGKAVQFQITAGPGAELPSVSDPMDLSLHAFLYRAPSK